VGARDETLTGQFFVVEAGGAGTSHDTTVLPAEGSSYGDAPRCEECGQPLAMRRWLPPFRVELQRRGRQWGDFAFFGLAAFLVSDAAVATLAGQDGVSLDGLEEVEVISATPGDSPPVYRHVEVPLGGEIDPARSRVAWSPSDEQCGGCSPGCTGVDGFAVASWQGDDLFGLRNLSGIVVATQRLKEMALVASLTNLTFTPCSQFSWHAFA
jgi:hypothetical protein